MSSRSKLWVRLAIVLAIWTGLAVVLTGQSYLIVYSAAQAHKDLPRQQPPLALTELFLSSLAECLVWAFMTIGILWLATRFPLGQGKWRQSLPIHGAACLGCACLEALLSVLAAEVIRQEYPKPTITRNVLLYFVVAKLNNNIFFYWAIVAVGHVLNYYRQLRDRELLSAQLEAKLAQTQLQILKMQLQPHFLFNTLNAISALIHQDVELADQMIARLGDLLRTTLDNANQQEVPFQQELDFIQPYLEIEKARLGPRLTVDLQIDPAVMDARVPNLILQPLVENAIRHGIAVRPGPGRIRIQAARANGCLHLAVTDTGPGLHAPPETLKGIGLANTRARLEKLYGANQRLELTNGPNGGLHVGITIPYQETSGDVAAEVSVKIRTLIVDDEPLARQRLRKLLEADPEIAIVGESSDGREAVADLRNHRPDLVFLDVQMPALDGFGVLQALSGAVLPVVIFVTAHDRYALKAFEVHALDYLLKPFDKSRFAAALERAKAQVRQGSAAALDERLHAFLQTVQDRRPGPERLVVKSAGRIYFVRTDDVDWIEAAGNYVRLHVGREDHLLRESLTALEKKLDGSRFVRIHRSTIVNLARIRELQPVFHGDYVIILRDGTELALSRSFRDRLEESLGHAL